MTERHHNPRFSTYVGTLTAVLVVMTVAAVRQSSAYGGFLGDVLQNHLAVVLMLALAAIVAELLDVVLPRGQISVSYPIHVAAVVFFGPVWAVILALFSATALWLERGKPASVKLFNTAMFCLCGVTAGLVYIGLGGVPLHIAGSAPVLALIAAGTVGAIVNLILGSLGHVFYREEKNWARVAQAMAAMMLPSQVALGLVGVALAEILARVGVAGFALFVLPLLVARQTYQRSEELRQAYADTISSLVAALEAKDLYTKGHSVRVARYTVAIANELGFDEDRIARIERAALLHDIGKVGVRRAVLAKKGRLSSDEYTEIKRHPAIGAHILEDVPYLAELVPAIEAHHERLDGTGYGRGVSREFIPIEARILAVADSYDAMTSTRSYRSAMSHEDAIAELERCRNSQFDGAVVDAFLAAGIEPRVVETGASEA